MSLLTKQTLRDQLQQQRAGIPLATRTTFSQMIVNRLARVVDWHEVRRLHCYIPLLERSEVDTTGLLDYVWRHWPRIEIVMPGPMRAGRATSYVVTAEMTWRKVGSLPYPAEIRHAQCNDLDLIVVPCVGFDGDRNRLGYGGGYYDRFLVTQPRAEIIGVAFWAGYIAEGLPHESHDVTLHRIITEEGML